MILSIVICTHNRVDLLAKCMDGLFNQTGSAADFEVIVVDNASTDGTAHLVKDMIEGKANYNYILEEQTGLSHARNRGLEEARGEWVAFIDDDASPFPDYTERVKEITDKHSFACFGGPCQPVYTATKPGWYLDDYENAGITKSGEAIFTLEENQFVSGFNIVFERKALIDAGGFNPNIGMKGSTVAYGEETQVQIELRKAGEKIGYSTDLVVYHHIGAKKLKLSWFFKSSYARGRYFWGSFKVDPGFRDALYLLKKILWQLILLPIRNLPTLGRKDVKLQNYLISTFQNSCFELGRLTGIISPPKS